MFRRRFIYIQAFRDHFAARMVGEDRRARRDCHGLDNAKGNPDFMRIQQTLKSLLKDMNPGLSLRKPIALMHFLPEHYQPTQAQLKEFKQTAEQAGISFCWLSTWERSYTNQELGNLIRLL